GYENGAGVNNNNNNTDNQCCKTPSQDHTASSNNSEAIKNHENKIKSANQGGSSWLSDAWGWVKNNFYASVDGEVSIGPQIGGGLKDGLTVIITCNLLFY
ncbi:MAG TPA: hypothetical protein VHA52_01205, partial [Candidatus Babeliaceae bacterium]|nr:hypothetical protein [Candidatus Babeliaceae bacterium]